MSCILEETIKKFYKSDPISRGELINDVAASYKSKGFNESEIKEITDLITI